MEQKLAEFRARRQADNAAKKDQCAGLQSKTETETVTESAGQTETPADSQQTENIQTSTHSPQSEVRLYSHLVYRIHNTIKVNILKCPGPSHDNSHDIISVIVSLQIL